MEKLEKNNKENETNKITKTASIRGLEESYVPAGMYFGAQERSLFTSVGYEGVNALYETIKKSPEAMACIYAIVEDIMADGYQFIGSDHAVKKTTKFAIESNFFKVLANAIFELILTGNAYILKLGVTQKDINGVITELTPKILSAFKLGKIGGNEVFELIDQTFKIPKDLQLLKSSTVSINFDETGQILSYEQKVGSKKRIYKPEDIIHISLVNIGGNPYGFSTLEPTLSDIATLIFAKEYVGKYFENDGVPHFIFKMPNEAPDSPNYKLLKKELKEFKLKNNKFRGMILTGEVDPIVLDKLNKDMEYSKLIQHFTQLILMSFGVPPHRIHYVLAEKTQGSQTNRAFEGYYKKIRFLQSLLEEALNKELFEVFNTEIRFYGAYRIDEMRQAQIVQILSQIGAITIEEARELMNMPRELIGERTNKVGDDLKINFNEDKRREQGRDNNPKPADAGLDNKLKETRIAVFKGKTKEVLKEIEATEQNISERKRFVIAEVSYDVFRIIVERVIPFHQAKILYEITEGGLYLYFTTGDWKYRTFIETNNPQKFLQETCPLAIEVRFNRF